MIVFVQARRNMIESQLRPCDVRDPLLLGAFGDVPRERFVGQGKEAFAYIDQNIALSEEGERRHMLQPMVLGRMLQALEILPGEKALDVGCGYGYATALMNELGASVVALESDQALVAAAREQLANRNNVSVISGELSDGAPQHAPFDIILVNGAVETMPDKLLNQLRNGGRLVVIQDECGVSRVVLYTRSGDAFGKREIIDAAAPVLKAFHKDSAFVF